MVCKECVSNSMVKTPHRFSRSLSIFAVILIGHFALFLMFRSAASLVAKSSARLGLSLTYVHVDRLPEVPILVAPRAAYKSKSGRGRAPVVTTRGDAAPELRRESHSGEDDSADVGTVDLVPKAAAPELILTLPPERLRETAPATPAELALRDPRTNTVRLARGERFAIEMGEYGCVYERRLPDGSIQRGPGHFERAANLPGDPLTGRVAKECVPS